MEFFGLGGRSNNIFNINQLVPQIDNIRNDHVLHPVNDVDEMIIEGDDFDGGVGNDPLEDAAFEQPQNGPKRKRYHRHSAYQIQRLEETFNEFPHPDDKQRKELSRELGLSPVQIKFWFQNKRTQIKNQSEREENQRLKEENDKLLSENLRFKDALNNACCPTCGGPTTLGKMTFDEQQLRIENARLRDEIDRISAMTMKLMGKSPVMPRPALLAAGPSRLPSEFGMELAPIQSGFLGTAFGAEAFIRTLNCRMEVDKPFVLALAQFAMLELIEMAQQGEPLWHIGQDGSPPTLNEEEYARRFPGGLGHKMNGLKTEASRDTATVNVESRRLIDFFMDSSKWALLFSNIVSRGTTVQVYSKGSGEEHDGVLQLVTAELQAPSPLVPLREGLFLRYCGKHDTGLWAIVDVSLEVRHNPMIRYRKRPSGCVIQEMPNGFSKVTWIEHVETDQSDVHEMYKPVLDSGLAFGAQRWVATLTRQCERMGSLIDIRSSDPQFHVNPDAMRCTLKLAEIMTASFCSGISGSSAHHWANVLGTGTGDVKIRSRRSNGMPGRPAGTVLSASISFWLPVASRRIFDYLRNENSRTEWDVLLQGGLVAEAVRIENTAQPGNCVSILGVGDTGKVSKVMVLQETICDESCFYVIFAPVDSDAMSSVFNGGDPEYVALMPSGFAIIPEGTGGSAQGGTPPEANPGTGSLVTAGFQILVNSGPETKISMGSVSTVDNLVSDTCKRIKEVIMGLCAE